MGWRFKQCLFTIIWVPWNGCLQKKLWFDNARGGWVSPPWKYSMIAGGCWWEVGMRTGSGLEPSQHNVTKAMVNQPKIYHKWFVYYICLWLRYKHWKPCHPPVGFGGEKVNLALVIWGVDCFLVSYRADWHHLTIPHCIPADPLVTLWQSNGGMGNPLVLVGKTSMWENPLLYHAWLPYKVLHFQRPPWALLSPRQLSLTGLASQYDWSTQKRPWAKSGCLWFGGTCMDSWWFKITSEKDEGNSYKKFPQLLKKTMASPYSVTSLEWWFIYETFLNGWTCSAIFRIVTDYNSAIDGLQALVSRWFHLGFWPGWTDRCRSLG
jgi:hypothetical protein